MSKSFTASAILLLRDAGALALDDPAAQYVPELAGWTCGSADAAPVTIRQLLTMTAGFPTDDPWGDRQQGLPITAFDELLAAGVSFNWAPGTRFEYSNLGYAILGRVLTMASGVPLRRVHQDPAARAARPGPDRLRRRRVRAGEPGRRLPARARRLGGGAVRPVRRVRADGRRVLDRRRPRPLGGRVRGRVPARRSRRRQRRKRRAPAPPGVAAADAAAAGGDRLAGGRAAAGRPARAARVLRVRPVRRRGPVPRPGGLAQRRVPGVRVQHALAPGHRHRRDRPRQRDLRPDVPADRPGPRRPGAGLGAYQVALAPAATANSRRGAGAPWPQTLAAQEQVNHLLADWDDAAADALFTENVALDGPYNERRHTIGLIRERIGEFSRRPRAARPSPTPRPTAAGG